MGLLNVFVSTNSRPISGGNSFSNSAGAREIGKLRIMPFKLIWKSFLNRLLPSRIQIPRSELLLSSKGANTRCLECGWKYNFHRSETCPVCKSDKAYLLARGSILHDLLTMLLVSLSLFLLIFLAYRGIVNQ